MARNIAVLGEGSWGTALATILAHNGYTVKLWCHDPAVKKSIETTRINTRYAPGHVLDATIVPYTNLQDVVTESEWIFEAIPIIHLRKLLEQCKPFATQNQRWVITSKGIEQNTLLLPTQILDDVLPFNVLKTALLGPSFADEVLQKAMTAVTIGSQDCEIGLELQQLLANDYFRPYVTLDLLGIQVGAAIKNVIGLGVGLLEGAGYADNTRAFFCTRGLHEIMLLCMAFGGKQETVYGLSGVGDLMLSVIGKHSKNVAVGKQLGQGISLDEIIQKTGYVPEGINTVQSVYTILHKQKLELPVCRGIYQIIFEQKTIKSFLQELISRPLEVECR